MASNYRINGSELPFTTRPYSYEYIAERSHGKWRIRDSQDNACGSAEDEASAREAIRILNGG